MQQTAVVVNHHVAFTPLMAVNEFRLRGEFEKLMQQRTPILDRPSDNVGGMRPHIKGGPFIDGVRANKGLADGRIFFFLCRDQFFIVEMAARVGQAMHGNEPFEHTLPFVR
jgi:hypothetical protein